MAKARQTKTNNTNGHILHTNVPNLLKLTDRERVLCQEIDRQCGTLLGTYIKTQLGEHKIDVRTIVWKLNKCSELLLNSNLK